MSEPSIQRMAGLDTIMKSVGDWPKIIQVDVRSIYDAQLLKDRWNSNHIAFLPFCMGCKEPLDWVHGDPSILFECPKCGVQWIKNDTWKKDITKLSKEIIDK